MWYAHAQVGLEDLQEQYAIFPPGEAAINASVRMPLVAALSNAVSEPVAELVFTEPVILDSYTTSLDNHLLYLSLGELPVSANLSFSTTVLEALATPLTGQQGSLRVSSFTIVDNSILLVSVERVDGTQGALLVMFGGVAEQSGVTDQGSAAAGSLSWGPGEAGVKTLSFPLSSLSSEEDATFMLELRGAEDDSVLLSQSLLVEAGSFQSSPPPTPTEPPTRGDPDIPRVKGSNDDWQMIIVWVAVAVGAVALFIAGLWCVAKKRNVDGGAAGGDAPPIEYAAPPQGQGQGQAAAAAVDQSPPRPEHVGGPANEEVYEI